MAASRVGIGATLASVGVIGAAGLALIMSSEGLELSPYIDPVGIPTVCWGHTGPDVIMGRRWTLEQCEAVLLRDIQKHQAYLSPRHRANCIGNVRLTPNQRDALTSFVYNVGPRNFCGSTMARYLRAGQMGYASDQFGRWNKGRVRGRMTVLRGLTVRRQRERDLFLTVDRPEASFALSGRAAAIIQGK